MKPRTAQSGWAAYAASLELENARLAEALQRRKEGSLKPDVQVAVEALEECRRLREVIAELSGGMRLLAEEAEQNGGRVPALAKRLHEGADHGKAALGG